MGFRAAARVRYAEGLVLADAGHSGGAVYLWGYAGEMILKAAYFRAIGFTPGRPILPVDLRAAKAGAPELGVTWVGNWHDVQAWAGVLVRVRSRQPTGAYRNPACGLRVGRTGIRLGRVWREALRYHTNTPYPHEIRDVREAAGWLVEHSLRL